MDELKDAWTRLDVHRQEWRLPPKAGEPRGAALKDGAAKLADVGVGSGATLHLKDLGPQVGYSTVFFWEYFGPIVAYVLVYNLPELVYGAAYEKTETQRWAYWYFVGHFQKRIMETFFVHRFSHATMPVFNLWKNTAYYTGFAAFVAYFLCHPLYTSPPPARVRVGLGLALVMQASNFVCHVILRNLRRPGEKGYKIPKGFLFNYVTCANYCTEIYGWFFFNVATQSVWGVLFMLAGAGQMLQWAVAKHKRLRKLFDGKNGREKYPRRWIILPPFI